MKAVSNSSSSSLFIFSIKFLIDVLQNMLVLCCPDHQLHDFFQALTFAAVPA
jgi:hypothetical protein